MMAIALLIAAATLAEPPRAPAIPPAAIPPAAIPPATIPPATIDDSLEIAGDPLAARRILSRMAVDVRVNGTGPFRFVVDSGADRTVVGTAVAARLALPAGDPVKMRTVTGIGVAETVRLDRLRIGGSEIDGIEAPALPEEHLGAQGLIGIDALVEQRLMLDFVRRTITVEDARRPAPDTRGEIVVTARRRKGQLILAQVRADGSEVLAVIDTGAEMTIGNSALRRRVLRGRRPPPSTPMTLVSVTGESIVAEAMRLRELRIGTVTLRDVTVAFTDAPPFALFGLATQPAMLLGTDVLEVFERVSLDFRRRKVRFMPRL